MRIRFRETSVLTSSLLLIGALAFHSPSVWAQDSKPGDKPAEAKPADAAKPVEKVKLAYKAEKGRVRKSKNNFSFQIPSGPQKNVMEGTESVKRTFTDIAANGDITFEEITEESKTSINGESVDNDGDETKETETYTIRPNGQLLKYKSTDKDNDGDNVHLDERLFVASTPIFPENPVGVGDKWTHEYKADDTLGLRPAKADFEILGMEKLGTTETVRLRMSFAESEANGVVLKAVFLLEKITGDILSAEYKVESYPLAPKVIASGNVFERRTDGGPIAASQNVQIADKSPDKPKDKTIDETVKDFEKLPGLFTMYRKKETGKDSLFLEITEAQLDKLLLLQTTASTGNSDQLIAGDPISDIIFSLTKTQDDRIMLTIPNWRWRAEPNSPVGRSLKRWFPDGYLMTFKIEAKQTDRKSYLIDVSDFFKSDFAQISLALMGQGLPSMTGTGMIGGYGMDRDKTYLKTVKNFPENLVIQTQYHFMRGGRTAGSGAAADNRSLPLLVNYNLFPLPNDAKSFAPTNGFKPREADPRVGYFTTEFTDFRDDSKEDQTTRYILRWDLRKKDPTAALSEPVKPIVFWLDNAIPFEYRPSVKKGVLAWNKAFERIGIKNAIVVNQMPDNADWDHADMRYNVVRWAITPDGAPRNGVAIALFRENPLTGQILAASVTVDAAWTRFAKLERRKIIDPAAAFARASGMDTDLLLDPNLKVSSPELQEQIAERKRELMLAATGNPRYCRMAESMVPNAYLGASALRFLAPAAFAAAREKEYTDQMVVELVAHEFGHILGLRHNFIASTELTLDQLKDPNVVRSRGIGASVMDYNAFNVSAIRAKGVDFFSQNVGTYDNWAVEYGYSHFTSGEDPAKLKKIASKSNEPGHAYQSDEQVLVGLDPRIMQGDISADPLAYWERILNLSRYLLVNLDKTSPKPGESYWEFTKSFQMLLSNYSSAAGVASRYIGGLTLNRNHKGDPNEKPVTDPIEAARQKQALALLNAYIFSPDALVFPERYYTRFTTDPFGFSFSADFPIADQISGIQRTALSRLFSSAVLRRIANSEFKRGGDPNRALTLPTLFSSVTTNVWAELGQRKNIPTLRRQLQRVWLDTMIGMVTGSSSAPDDATMLAWDQLRQIRARLASSQSSNGVDEYTRIHLSDSLTKVDRVLKAGYTLNGGGGDGGASLLQLLFGRPTP